MKRSLIIAISIILLTATSTKAQQVFYSKIEKFTFQKSDFKAIGWCGNRLYTYRASKEGYFLDAYNDSMRLLATVALDFIPERTAATEFYTTNNNELIVLYQTVKSNYLFQYAVVLDTKARMTMSPVVLDSVRSSWIGGGHNYFSSKMSRDKSKLLVFAMGKKKSGKHDIKTVLLDDKLNFLSAGTVYIESTDELSLGQSVIANNGNFYFSAFNGVEGRTLSGDVWLFKLQTKEQQLKDIQLPLQKNYMAGVYLRLNDNTNEIYVTAFYSNRKHGDNEGIVYGAYDIEKDELSSFKLIPFDNDLRAATDIRNRSKAFNDMEIRNVVVKNDGGFLLVAENYYISTRSNNQSQMMGYYSWYNNMGYGPGVVNVREYNYGDIMLVNYDGEGKKVWSNFIRKSQFSQDDNGLFSSFALLNSGANLVFLFNNFTSNRSTVNLASVDAEGNLQLKRMNQGSIAGLDWIPRVGKQIDALEYLIPVLRKNNLGFVRVGFN